MDKPLKAYIILAATIILWGSAFVGIRATLVDYSPTSIALLRYLIASFTMLIFYWRLPKRRKPSLSEAASMMLLGVIGFAIYNISLAIGEQTVTAGIAGFIVSQMPILISIAAYLVFKEALSRLSLLGFLVSFIGICLIAIGESEQGQFDWGIMWIIITALSGALYSFSQKFFIKRFHPIEFTSFAIWGGTLAMLLFWPDMWHDIKHATIVSTSTVIYMGIFPGAIAYIGWCYAFGQLSAAKASSFLYGIPIVATFLGWLWLTEIPHWIALCGGLLALFGAFIVNRTKQA